MLNNIGPLGFLLIAVVVLVLFGRGKVSGLMGEVGKGITAFKRGVSEGQEEGRREIDDEQAAQARDVTSDAAEPTRATAAERTAASTAEPAAEKDRV